MYISLSYSLYPENDRVKIDFGVFSSRFVIYGSYGVRYRIRSFEKEFPALPFIKSETLRILKLGSREGSIDLSSVSIIRLLPVRMQDYFAMNVCDCKSNVGKVYSILQ